MRKAGPPPQRPPKLKLKASVARSRRAPIIEEEDFLEEPEPNMKLSHAFVVVLVLHVIAVAGVFAFNSIKANQSNVLSALNSEAAKPSASEDATVAASASTAAPEAADPSNGPAIAQPAAQAPAVGSAPKTHELQPGETLTKVAAQYGVSVQDLMTTNSIEDAKKIRAGTVLTIPYDNSSSSQPVAVAPVAYKPVSAPPIHQAEPVHAAPIAAAPVKPAPVAAKPAAPAATDTGVKDSGKVYTVVKGDNPVKIAKTLKVPYAALMALNGHPDPTKLQIGQKLKIPAAK